MKSYLLIACAVAFCVSGCKKDPVPEPPVLPTPDEVITEVTNALSKADTLSNFMNALKSLELSQDDVADGLTIFAPLNNAEGEPALSAKKPNRQMATAAAESDAAEMVVKDHVVKGVLKFADLTNDKILTALSGKQLKITRVKDSLWVNGTYVGGVELAATDNQVVYATKQSLTGTTVNDVATPTTFQITVYDATQWTVDKPKGVLAPAVDVVLYRSREDYATDKPAHQAKTSDNGVATFINIPAGTYYIEVSKDDKSNILSESMEPIDGVYTGYGIMGIFQSQSEIEEAALQKNSVPGNFRWIDVNSDGLIDTLDKTSIPYESGRVVDGMVKTVEVLMGKVANVVPVMTEDQFNSAFSNIASSVSLWQAEFAVLDANLSDQVDTDTIPALRSSYTGVSRFAFQPNTPIIHKLWTKGYEAITALNNLAEDVAAMQDKQLAIAKIKALRAFIYLTLHTYYGAIPLIQTADQLSNLRNTDEAAVKQFIAAELESAATVLPAKSNDRKALTSTAARLLWARLALLEKDYARAKTLTESIINESQYTLATSNAIYTSNGAEIILENYSAALPAVFRDYFFNRATLPYIRLTEVYLINVEANLQTGGQAAAPFNMLLQRRGLPTVNTVTVNEFRERWVAELRREGLTFPALLRWETAADKLGYKGFVMPKHENLPIPQQVVDQNSGILQNPGY